MHTFYVENGLLSKEDARHAFRVLRLKCGDDITAICDNARWTGRVNAISESTCEVQLMERLPDTEAPIEITVYQGLPKLDKLEYLAQKLTELGVTKLAPVKMTRSVAKFDGDKRTDRLQKISREAVKQCGRSKPMSIMPPMSWNEALNDMKSRELLLIPWEKQAGTRMRDVFSQNKAARDIGILIGPEGGIEVSEVNQASGKCVTLGPRILRTETAAVVAASIAMELWGDI